MGRHVLNGNPPIAVSLRRSARARRLSLRLSRTTGEVTLTLPKRAAEAEALAFLKERESWLRGHLEDLPQVRRVDLGLTLPVLGREVLLTVGPVRRAELTDDGRLVLPNRAAQSAGARAAAFLKILARDRLAESCDRYAARLGKPYSRLSLRDPRSRWGSCTAEGHLMFSWRLVLAPPEVLDYVAAHEVAHLQEMNHAPAFWAVVERLCPGHGEHRAWLRQNGEALHRLRFTD